MPASVSLTASDFSLLCEVVEAVARTSGLSPEEADDFAQTAQLKLIERNYAPLAQFAGRSSLRTYLTVVVKRLLLDWRNSRFGKWRPSSSALRLGAPAVDLDRLISRDGHPVDEAVAILAGRPGAPSAEVLCQLAAQLPRRSRLRSVTTDDVEELGARAFDDPVEIEQATVAKHRALRRLRLARRQLGADDRQLLYLRFERSLSVAAISQQLGTPAKPLYRRLERLFRDLRRDLIDNRVASISWSRTA